MEEADDGCVWMVGKVQMQTVNLNLKQFEVPPGMDVALSHVGRKGKKKKKTCWPI